MIANVWRRLRALFRRPPDNTPPHVTVRRDAFGVPAVWWRDLTPEEKNEDPRAAPAPRERWLAKRERPRW